jgi:uncharacterized Ntn-hydrolase superfamily protein
LLLLTRAAAAKMGLMRFCLLFVLALAFPAWCGAEGPPNIGTFSIVARDPATGELGVAVQSRVIAVGAIVPYARAGLGAIATQAWGNPAYGPEGLRLLQQGKSPDEVIQVLTSADPQRGERQVGVLAADGRTANFTGEGCIEWAGGRTGKDYAVQGNLLAGEAVVKAMAESFESSHGDFGTRLLEALEAGQRAGGDKRGMQSAALLIVHEGWGYGGLTDRYRDLRVDDHPKPIEELRRIYELHRRAFPAPREA